MNYTIGSKYLFYTNVTGKDAWVEGTLKAITDIGRFIMDENDCSYISIKEVS